MHLPECLKQEDVILIVADIVVLDTNIRMSCLIFLNKGYNLMTGGTERAIKEMNR